MTTSIKAVLREQAASNLYHFLVNACEVLPENETATMSIYRLRENRKYFFTTGTIDYREYETTQNQIFQSCQDLIRDLSEEEAVKLADRMRQKNAVYRILTISKNEDERQRMKLLFNRFHGPTPESITYNEYNETTYKPDKYDIIVFDNLSFGSIDRHKKLDEEGKKQLELFKKWLKDKKNNPTKPVVPGFLVHYGKYFYLLEDNADYCAAANFPFTLLGLLRQIIDFWKVSDKAPRTHGADDEKSADHLTRR